MARQRELLVPQQMASLALQQQIQAIQQLNVSNPQLRNSYDTVIQNMQMQIYQLQSSPECKHFFYHNLDDLLSY